MAHDKGIVHRDIKPDNVFLAADALGRKQPKLLDFGIAKVDKQIDGRLTQVGAVLGSPDYMSPEQALGLDDIDERTDIWSLCVVLYEVITGTVPFQKPNYNALMHAIINEDPDALGRLRRGRQVAVAGHRARPAKAARRSLPNRDRLGRGPGAVAVRARHQGRPVG